MMAEHKRIPKLLLLGLLPLLSVLMACAIVDCLIPVTPRVRNFEIDELLIDMSVFPPGWRVSRSPWQCEEDQGQVNDRCVEFRPRDGTSNSMHIVYQYRDDLAAAYWYTEYLPAEFGSVYQVTPWQIPESLQYQSQVADQFRSACADFQCTYCSDPERYTRCTTMGQYDEYVSVFFTYISPESMTYADLERILKAIDERMAHYLGKEGE